MIFLRFLGKTLSSDTWITVSMVTYTVVQKGCAKALVQQGKILDCSVIPNIGWFFSLKEVKYKTSLSIRFTDGLSISSKRTHLLT